MYHLVGGTGYEPGGPGMTYFHGNHVRNLRLDNKCQRPRVTEPASTSANQAQFESYKRNGNAAYIGHLIFSELYSISLNWFTFIYCQKVTVDYPSFLTLWREWKQCTGIYNQPWASEDDLYNKVPELFRHLELTLSFINVFFVDVGSCRCCGLSDTQV